MDTSVDSGEDARHACGWSGPRWLHISGLCASCKGVLPRLLDGEQRYAEPCAHPRCVKYRLHFGSNDET